MIIRPATMDDCMKLSVLKQKMWNDTYRGIYSDSKIDNFNYDEHKKEFEKLVASENINLYIAVEDEEIAAYMSCGEIQRKFLNYTHEIGLLYVRKDFQHMGLGRKLFSLGKQELKSKGVREFIISCNKYNMNAQKFYSKMGGKIVSHNEDSDDKSNSQVKFLYTTDS